MATGTSVLMNPSRRAPIDGREGVTSRRAYRPDSLSLTYSLVGRWQPKHRIQNSAFRIHNSPA